MSTWGELTGENITARLEDDVRQLLRRVAETQAASISQAEKYREETRRLLLALIEVQDAFERVLANIEEKQKEVDARMKIWLGNFRTVYRLLQKVLHENGVLRIEGVQGEFDPRWHTVTQTVADSSKEDGAIIREEVPGYMWHEELLRRVGVIVAKRGGETEDAR